MKLALAPFMHRHLPVTELPRPAADLGYEHIGLSPRADFLDGIVTSCVFAWEERAVEASRFMRQEIQRHVDKRRGAAA